MTVNPTRITLEELIALNQQAARLNVSSNSKIFSQRVGNYRALIKGRGMEFEEVRFYQPGDDIRSIDWRVTARTGVPHTKLYREEKERPVFFIIDQSQNMFFGTQVTFKSVIAAQSAALLGWAAAYNNDRIGALIHTGEEPLLFRPKIGRRTLLPILKKLSEIAPGYENTCPKSSLPDVLDKVRALIKPGSYIFMISDFSTVPKESYSAISNLLINNSFIPIFVYDPLELSPPPPGHYTVSDGVNFNTINMQTKAQRELYQHHFRKHLKNLEQFFKLQGIPLLKIATYQDCTQVLKQALGTKSLARGIAEDSRKRGYY